MHISNIMDISNIVCDIDIYPCFDLNTASLCVNYMTDAVVISVP